MLKDKVEVFLNQLRVMALPGFTKTRVGKPSDGGYVVVDELCQKTQQVYTYGVGSDVSFELEFARRYPGTKFQLFDPTIQALPQEHPDFTFIKRGMPQAAYSPGFAAAPKGSILKMDIEWNEWQTLDVLDQPTLCKFDQILIELHLFTVGFSEVQFTPYFTGVLLDFSAEVNASLYERYSAGLAKLLENFHIFHVHANNSLAKRMIGGHDVPPLLELSLVRKDLVEAVEEYSGPFPCPVLDYQNKMDRPDITEYHTFLPGAW